jgi:hypothetical protein
LRKTKNSIYCVGELITTEFIEEVSKFNNKEYRQFNAIVRYEDNMQIQFTMKYNKENAKGEKSVMYDFLKNVFDKYNPSSMRKVMTSREANGKPIWNEIYSLNGIGDRVICKAELAISERPYLSKKTNTIEIGINNIFKLNGKYGITHAKENDENCARFNLEMIIYNIVEQNNNDESIMYVNGLGISQIINNYSVYPISLRVRDKGIEKINDQFDEFNIKTESVKAGVSALFKGDVLIGKEKITIDTKFDGTPVLTDKNINEFRVNVSAKNIIEFDEDNPNEGFNPDEVQKLIRERAKRNNEKKERYKLNLNYGNKDEEEKLPL